MAKKKKKKKDGPKPLISKKNKKKLIKFLLLTVLIGGGYTLVNPDVIPDPEKRQQVLNARENLLSLNKQGQDKILQTVPQTQKLTAIADKVADQGIVLGDQEIYVEDAVKNVTQSLEALPATQLKKIKADFCADVITEALIQATQSATPDQ